MSYIDWKDLLHATNGGLDIIRLYYDKVDDALKGSAKKFRATDGDRTPSSSLRLKSDGFYYVTHFNGDQKERNAIGICTLETGKPFAEAIQYLAAYFKIEGSKSTWTEIKPTWETRPLRENEKAKDYSIVDKEFSESELQLLGPCVSAKHCEEFNFVSVKQFDYCKENEASVTSSTDSYPIYAFHHDDWAKVYQPLSFQKQYRFRFLGQKPKRFLFGLDLLRSQFEKNKKKIADEYEYEAQVQDANGEAETVKLQKGKAKDPRVDYVFIVSGGSDGLNLRSFGYFPIWFNSESETLNYNEYRLLQQYAKEIIYIPDLDNTGLKQALEIALKFLDIKVMMLPNYLKLKRDKRGNECKDFKDFVVHFYNKLESKSFNNRLKKLIENALPAEFWSKHYTKNGYQYKFRRTQFYNFLKMNGFGRIKDEHTKEGYHFVHIDGNVVRKVLPVEIEEFVHRFLKDRQMPIELRDLLYTQSLNSNSLNKLDAFQIKFKSAEKDAQYMFFENAVLKITATEIERKKRGNVDLFIWDKKMLKHNITIEKPQFKITKDVHGNEDIQILKKDNMFFNYLINASRIHWRKELEESLVNMKASDAEAYRTAHKFNIEGPHLTDEEKLEQKLHLINKIYALGYILHTYKSPQKPWAVYAMDNKLADINESHGGSGKSVYQKAIQNVLLGNHYIPGRDSQKTKDDFIYHGVTEETDFLFVDDCNQYLDYGFFFPAITGDLEVNNKNGLRFIIPFDDVFKIAFSSNYPPNNLDPSLSRRLLYTIFSDYYHFNMDGEYKESRAISDDFDGATLFKDFNEIQWNGFYNFCAQAVQFYLSRPEKVDPPMANVTLRNLLSEMGATFKDWAEVFFAKKNETNHYKHLDKYVLKDMAFDDLKTKTGAKFTSTKFKKRLIAFCQFNEWVFNPKEMLTDGNRILQSIDGNTREVFYIKTTNSKQSDAISASKNEGDNQGEQNDDLPF